MNQEQVAELVEERLRAAQANKVYQDFGRIRGTAKERKALGFITVTVVDEQERTVDELAALVQKAKVLPKFDPQQERANGNTAGAAYFRYQVYRAWIPKPTVKEREVFRLYVEALTQFNGMTERDTDLRTAVAAFRRLFDSDSGTLALRMGEVSGIQAKDWSRYISVDEGYKRRQNRMAAMQAILGKQVVKRASGYGMDWAKEGEAFEAIDVATATASHERIRKSYADQRATLSDVLTKASQASTKEEFAAANLNKNLWLDKVAATFATGGLTVAQAREQFAEFVKRRGEYLVGAEQEALQRTAARDDDWTWTATYFGRETKRSDSGGGTIQVNSYPNLDHLERKDGLKAAKSVSPAQLADNWGLRAVQYGNSLTDGESARLTYWANCSFLDMADLLNLDVRKLNAAMGIGLDLATRGKKGSVATYWPSYKVINLNRDGGDGSLAHEWAHALDHWMGQRRNAEGYLTESLPVASDTAARGSEQAMRRLMSFITGVGYDEQVEVKASAQLMYRLPAIDMDITPAQFFERLIRHYGRYAGNRKTQESIAASVAKAYGVDSITVPLPSNGSDQYQGSTKMKSAYWAKQVELFARGFEGYMMHLLANREQRSDYLQTDRGAWFDKFSVYPSERDLVHLVPLFDALLDQLRKEEGLQLDLRELPIAEYQGSGEPPRESFTEASSASGKPDETGDELAAEQEREAQNEPPASDAAPVVAMAVTGPEPAPVPPAAPPAKKAPKLGKFAQLVQSAADAVNAAIEQRNAKQPDDGPAGTYRLKLGSMAQATVPLKKAEGNVDAVHVLDYGPHAIYLHRDWVSYGWGDRKPMQLERYTMSAHGLTFGIEQLAGNHTTRTKASTLEAFAWKMSDIVEDRGAASIIEVLEKAQAGKEPITEADRKDIEARVAVGRARKGRKGGAEVTEAELKDVKASLARMAEKRDNPLPYAKLLMREQELQEKLSAGTATAEELKELMEAIYQLYQEGAYRSEPRQVYKGEGRDPETDQVGPTYETVQPEQTEEQRYTAELRKVQEALSALTWPAEEQEQEPSDPEPSAQEREDAENDARLRFMYDGADDASMETGQSHVPQVGERVALGLDAVDVKAKRIILAKPGAAAGVAVFNEAIAQQPARLVLRTARWEKDWMTDGWNIEERTSWPNLREAVAGIYGAQAGPDLFDQQLEELASKPTAELKGKSYGKRLSAPQYRKVRRTFGRIARTAPASDAAALRDAAERIQALRGFYGVVDADRTSKRTLPLTKPNLRKWAKNPGRYDLQGIDTPKP